MSVYQRVSEKYGDLHQQEFHKLRFSQNNTEREWFDSTTCDSNKNQWAPKKNNLNRPNQHDDLKKNMRGHITRKWWFDNQN